MLLEVSLGGVKTRYEYFADKIRSAYVRAVVRDPDVLARRTTYEVDVVGRVLSMEGETGAREEYRFDGLGRRIESTIRAPGTSIGNTRWTYDRRGRLVSCVERVGVPPSAPPSVPVVQRWEHDAFGRITCEILGEGTEAARTRFVFGLDGELEKIVDAVGGVTRTERDISGRIRRVRMAVGTPQACSREFRWSADGRLARVVDDNGHETQFEHDAFGRLCVRVDRDGVRVEQTLDAAGRRLREVVTSPRQGRPHERWSEREWDYDALGRLIVERVYIFDAPSDATDRISTTRFYYDDAGRCTRIVEDGATTQLTSDGLGRRTRTIDPDGILNTVSFDDAARRVTYETSSVSSGTSATLLARREVFRLDAFGRPTTITDGLGNVGKTLFDTAGRAAVSIDPSGAAKEHLFNSRGTLDRIDTVVGGTRSTLRIRQDLRGDPRQFDYPSGRWVAIDRDALGRPFRISDGATTIEQLWDGNGLLRERRDSDGTVVHYSYSPGDRLSRIVADTSGVAPGTRAPLPVPPCDYTWTPLGGLATATDGRHTVRCEYDSRGGLRFESVNGVLGQWSLRGRLNGTGGLETLTYSDGRRVTFGRSAANRALGCDLAEDGAQGLGSAVAPASLITLQIDVETTLFPSGRQPQPSRLDTTVRLGPCARRGRPCWYGTA